MDHSHSQSVGERMENQPYFRRNDNSEHSDLAKYSKSGYVSGTQSPKKIPTNSKCRICNIFIQKIESQIEFEGSCVHMRCLNHSLWHNSDCDCSHSGLSKHRNKCVSPGTYLNDEYENMDSSQHSTTLSTPSNMGTPSTSIHNLVDYHRSKSPSTTQSALLELHHTKSPMNTHTVSSRNSMEYNHHSKSPTTTLHTHTPNSNDDNHSYDHSFNIYQFVTELVQPSNISSLRLINSNFLIEAARKNHAAVLSAFLNAQFDPLVIDYQDEFGRTALIWSSQRGHLKCFRLPQKVRR